MEGAAARDPTTSGHSGSGCPAPSPESAQLPHDIMAIPPSLQWEIDQIPRNRKITLGWFAVDGIEPGAAVFPNTIEEVSHLLSSSDRDSKAVVPWGWSSPRKLVQPKCEFCGMITEGKEDHSMKSSRYVTCGAFGAEW